MIMSREITQVELTDQELEQVIGGAGIGSATITTITTTPGGSTGGQASATGAGTTSGLGAVSGGSTAIDITIPGKSGFQGATNLVGIGEGQ